MIVQFSILSLIAPSISIGCETFEEVEPSIPNFVFLILSVPLRFSSLVSLKGVS